MELNTVEKLREAISATDKCIKEIEEMLRIEESHKNLLAKAKNAKESAIEAEKAGKQALALEKVLESMRERLEREIATIGLTMTELKNQYKEKSEKEGIGTILEAVPE
ncbi:MAG: hypothetical protein QXK06_04400 [Candidatus Diapherotrites archaeon]